MNYDFSKCPVVLESFCDKDSSRYDLGLPFQDGDYVYATDGRICVRVKAVHYGGVVATEGKFPMAEDLGWDKTVTEWMTPPQPEPCAKCNDLRVIPYPYLDEFDDDVGDQNVLIPCKHCYAELRGRHLKWMYVDALLRFSAGVQIGVSGKDVTVAVHFRFDRGEALLMPTVLMENK